MPYLTVRAAALKTATDAAAYGRLNEDYKSLIMLGPTRSRDSTEWSEIVSVSLICWSKDSFITTWTEMSILGADHRRPTFH